MMQNLCLYHSSDADGLACGALFKRFMPNDTILFPIDYGQGFPWHLINKDVNVWIADFSFPIWEMLEIQSKCCTLIWIDHHQQMLEAYAKADTKIDGRRSVDRAACSLLYDHFYPVGPIPDGIRLISLWDIWKHEDPRVCYFQFGSRLHITNPLNPASERYWEAVLTNDWDFIAAVNKDGQTLFNYEKIQSEDLITTSASECIFEGLSGLGINISIGDHPYLFETIDFSKYDLGITYFFCLQENQWRVSLRNKEPSQIDCAKLAKIYGGGGHPRAAGFRAKDLSMFKAA